ncbi:hypothetical protein J5A58_00320 [Prevotella melaninogenica]|uniref:Uncharacterized protein n=1 Tax=Prevotella melaninogenica TaxID=28132 RepID=A0ABX7XPB1_9BACT|nr:hypothetical protein [Prevotella melaninogenica]QUB75508.1 hypothetical protein J5A58_00320 [Prevotella melaninogenica]
MKDSRAQHFFDVLISAIYIVIGFYLKDTTTIIEGGVLLALAITNIASPIKQQIS